MAALRLLVLVIGMGLISVPLIASLIGPLDEGRSAASRGASAPDGTMVATLGTWVTAASSALSSLTEGGAPGAVATLATEPGAPVSKGALALACRLTSAKTGLSEADCKAQLGPLASPGGIAAMFKGASDAMDAAAAPSPAPGAATAAITPRISVDTGRGVREGGGAKFIKVQR